MVRLTCTMLSYRLLHELFKLVGDKDLNVEALEAALAREDYRPCWAHVPDQDYVTHIARECTHGELATVVWREGIVSLTGMFVKENGRVGKLTSDSNNLDPFTEGYVKLEWPDGKIEESQTTRTDAWMMTPALESEWNTDVDSAWLHVEARRTASWGLV